MYLLWLKAYWSIQVTQRFLSPRAKIPSFQNSLSKPPWNKKNFPPIDVSRHSQHQQVQTSHPGFVTFGLQYVLGHTPLACYQGFWEISPDAVCFGHCPLPTWAALSAVTQSYMSVTEVCIIQTNPCWLRYWWNVEQRSVCPFVKSKLKMKKHISWAVCQPWMIRFP